MTRKKKKPAKPDRRGGLERILGGDLLSHRESPAVPLAQEVLTTEFEMGSGVTPPA